MLTFFSEDFKNKIIEIWKYIKEEEVWEYEFYELSDEDFNPNDYDNIEIREDTIFNLSLPRYEHYQKITVGEFIELVEESREATLIDNLICVTKKRYLIRVTTHEYHTIACLSKLFDENKTPVLENEIEFNGYRINVSLVTGLTLFGFMVAKQGDFDKYYPPVLNEDYFIEILFDKMPEGDIVENIIEAYLFELSASHGFELCREARLEIDSLEPPDEDFLIEKPVKLRPLILGKGIKDLLNLYNKATETSDPEFKVLYYAKVIEFVSQTVIRQEINNTIQGRLNSPKALNPDAIFILELEALIEEQRVFKKDREAITLTVDNCCDVLELKKVAPAFLKKFAQLNIKTNKTEKKDTLASLATCIVDTRNSIAHAKSNYQPTGNECPLDQMDNLAECLQLVAQQVIRWFGRQHENNRIV